MKKKIKVLVIDDSALMRKVYTDFLTSNQTEVVGTAIDAIYAMNKIQILKPDVLILDIFMPQMDGITFLEKLMKESPLPVIVISAIAKKGEEMAIKSLSMGALFFLEKPTSRTKEDLEKYKDDLIKKVIICSETNLKKPNTMKLQENYIPSVIRNHSEFNLVAIGASTGGPQAIESILKSLDHLSYIIIIGIHMPAQHTTEFAKRMNDISKLKVIEAQEGMPLSKGSVYICPGGKHLQVIRQSNKLTCYLNQPIASDLHKPSIDILFQSIAKISGPETIGIIMTGMSNDGAQGLLEMKKKSSLTIVQDKKSCIVYGMPKAAKEINAAQIELNIGQIIQLLKK